MLSILVYISIMINGVQNNSGAVRAIPDIYPRVCLAIAIINREATKIAREQGKRKGLEHRALMMRAEKNGEWDAKNEW